MAKRFKFRISRLIIPCFRPCGSKLPTTSLSASHDDDFLWKKDDKWHVIDTAPSRRKIHNPGGDALPLPSSKRLCKKKKRSTPRGRIRTSSADRSCGLLRRDGDEEEKEALVSSFGRRDKPPHHKEHKLRKKRKKKMTAFEGTMGWKVEGKVRESVAVVKKSEDPYKDFRRSMMEMIVEKKMFELKDLEQLLCCFLSLNSATYHPVIVQAFTDIWDTLFCFCIHNTS